jgi:hypothetical protein
MHQDPPDCATGALLLAVGADDDESVELVSGVVVVVVVVVVAAAFFFVAVAFFTAVVVVVARAGVAVDAVALPCRPITAAMTAAAAVEAAATAPVSRFTRRLPAARTFVFALSISMTT